MTPITAGESVSKKLTVTEDTTITVSAEAPLSILFDKKGLEAQGHKVTITGVDPNTIIKPRNGEVFTVTRTRVKIDVVPAEGYVLKKVISNRLGWSATATNEVVKQYEVDITAVEHGTVTLDGVESGDEVAVGTEVTINANPDKGYELESITVGGKDVTEAKKFVVGDDNTIIVKFKKATALEGLDAQIKLYPNPASEYAILSGIQAGVSVKLISLTGKTVLIKKADYTGEVRLELTNLPRGIYIVRAADKVFKLQVQ